MSTKLNFCSLGVLLLISSLLAQNTTLDWKWHDIGNVRHLVTNYGSCAGTSHLPLGIIGIPVEYPAGSGFGFGHQNIAIGARLAPSSTPYVSTAQPALGLEFFPSSEPWDSIWVVGRDETVDIPYWPNYTGISDQDFVCRYSDYNLEGSYTKQPSEELHMHPLHVDVIQTSHAWNLPTFDWIVFQYFIIPTKVTLYDLYFVCIRRPHMGSVPFSRNDDCTYFIEEDQLVVHYDGPGEEDDGAVGPVGYKVFTSKNIDPNSIIWIYNNYLFEEYFNARADEAFYEVITRETIDPPSCYDHTSFISLGPFERALGDTLHFKVGIVLGDGEDGMLENFERMERLVESGFRTPKPPPIPPFRIETDNHQVTLKWDPQPGEVNSETYTDSLRDDYLTEPQPFEGYRVYKSSMSIFGPWTLLTEFDIDGNDFYGNTGLQYHFTDFGLLNNVAYWYTLSAFSKPIPRTEFISLESSLNKNAVEVTPGTAAPATVGKIAVVPNPYRGDINYNAYKPPWEKSSGGFVRWHEINRRIQFINVPSPCEIKIYTLAGDLVKTIIHNNPDRGFADWNLVSEVGQTIASGIYLFSCEDNAIGDIQVGKFVVIK